MLLDFHHNNLSIFFRASGPLRGRSGTGGGGAALYISGNIRHSPGLCRRRAVLMRSRFSWLVPDNYNFTVAPIREDSIQANTTRIDDKPSKPVIGGSVFISIQSTNMATILECLSSPTIRSNG